MKARELLGKRVTVRNMPSAWGNPLGDIAPYSTIDYLKIVSDANQPLDPGRQWFDLGGGRFCNYIYPPNGARFELILEPPTPNPIPGLWRVRWDDELPEFNYTSRTAAPNWGWGRQTPAVFRHFPEPKEAAGEFRVNMSSVEAFTHLINPTDRQWRYYTGPSAGMFNRTGWPMQMNIVMSGNLLKGEPVNNRWFRFDTLTLATANASAKGIEHFIHHWTVIGARGDGSITHAEMVGDPQMTVYYPVMSVQGCAYIPLRYVAEA